MTAPRARGTSVTHTYGAPGTYTVTVRAQDSAGNTVSQTRPITVATVKDTTPPAITRLGVTNRRFTATRGRTALIAARRRTPAGTAFRFAISERATVVLTITRAGKGPAHERDHHPSGSRARERLDPVQRQARRPRTVARQLHRVRHSDRRIWKPLPSPDRGVHGRPEVKLMRLRFLLPAAIAATLSLAPAAHATGWVSSGPLSPDDRVASEPQVVVTPSGERVIAWVQNLQDGFTPENVSVRVAPPGHDFGATQTFAGHVDGPKLAVAADGTVALAWTESATRTVHIARMAPGQTNFVDATPLTVAGGETPFDVQLAFNGADAVAAFESSVDPVSTVWAARLPAGAAAVALVPGPASGGALDHASVPAGQPRQFVNDPNIAADGGKIFVSWQRQTEGVLNNNGAVVTDASTIVKYAPLNASGVLGGPVTLDFTVDNSEFAPEMTPRVAAGGGHAYVVWLRPRDEQPVNYEDVGTGGTQLRIPTDPFMRNLHVGADSSGTLIVAGDGEPLGSSAQAVGAATIPAGTTPAPAVRLTAPGVTRQTDALAVASDGSALVLPDRSSDGFSRTLQVFASRRLAGGAFAAPQDVSGLQDDSPNQFAAASAAIAPGGRALVLWASADNSGLVNRRLHLSELDTAPPMFGPISVPARGVAGQRVALSANATDALSPTTTISWEFGDGSQADGAMVSHVFGAPGTYRVVVTAVDGVGNSVSQTRVVSVAPAAVGVDRTPPVISRLSLVHSRFRVSGHGTASIAAARRGRPRAPIGTTIRLTLNVRATVAIQIRRRGVLSGTLIRGGLGSGNVSIGFTGRIGRSALAAGTYTATLTAINAAGKRSAARTTRFTVVKK